MKKVLSKLTVCYIAILYIIFLLAPLFVDAENQLQRHEPPHIVFLISKDPNNYEAHQTIPKFAKFLEKEYDSKISVLLGTGELNSFKFPNSKVLADADLIVIFFRRIALNNNQLKLIKNHLKNGRPLVGIRTANHAFSVQDGEIPEGYEQWWDFVPEILGAKNRGYGPTEPGTEVSIVPEAKHHPILEDVQPDRWNSIGNVYLVKPLVDEDATVLLRGKADGKNEPIAWARTAGKSRIFYTSLGHPDDFEAPQFLQLLINSFKWALEQDEEKRKSKK